MRIKILGFLFLSLLNTGLSAQNLRIDSSFSTSHYQQRLAFFEQMAVSATDVAFVGNSLTERGTWQELIPGKKVINRGIGGDNSFGILARIGEVARRMPGKIFLMVGINDLFRGIPNGTTLANYKKIIKSIRSHGPASKIFIQSVLPINELIFTQSYARGRNAQVQALNRKLQELASDEGITFIDLHPLFLDRYGWLGQGFTTDGVHLRGEAYIIWTDHLKAKGLL